MPKPKPDPELTRQKILDAAMMLMDSCDYASLTMKSVAREADMAVGKIYSFFADKQTLFIHLEMRFHTGLYQAVASALASVPESSWRLRVLLQAIFEYCSHNIGMVRSLINPAWVHDDAIGTELEGLASRELESGLRVYQLIADEMAAATSGIEPVPAHLQQSVLLVMNTLTGLILNSHSRNFPYYIGFIEPSVAVSGQLDLLAESLLQQQVEEIC